MDKIQAFEQMRKTIQMFASNLTEDEAMMVSTIYDKWKDGKTYSEGEYVLHGVNNVGDPQLYKVVQKHTSQFGWEPDKTSSLFSAIGLDENGYAVWSKPTGAHDAYNIGDIVDYNGVLYESTIDGNVYSPDEYPVGWKVVNS